MPTISVSTSSTQAQQRHFRRGYVACALCRAHKVRCVLGSEPPCAKCRREHRECVFDRPKRGPRTREAPRWAGRQPTQRQPADAAATDDSEQHESQATDTNINVNPDIDANHSDTTASQDTSRDNASSVPEGPEPANANVNAHAQRRPSNSAQPHLQVPAQSPTSLLERTICPNETLALFNDQGGSSAGSSTLSAPPPIPRNPHKRDEYGKLWHPPIVHELSQMDDEAQDVWSKIPFVRLGWFTDREALTYFDMFYRHLAPFCPALAMSETESGGSRHAKIAQEPMLCTTILMIASRFFTLPGPGGLGRSYLIYHRLWQQCERLIQLLMYGREKHLRGDRTLGTIQSLLLLSEWHPRSLRSLFACSSQSDMWEGREPKGSNQWPSESREQSCPARYEKDLLDRAKQSDRFSWMMVGQALNLAHEAGVFVDPSGPNDAEEKEWLGPLRTRKLLYVYVTNLSVRIGFQNTFTQDIILTRAILPNDAFGRRGAESCDLAMELWFGLVRLSRTASVMFFQSSSSTKDHLRNGDYIVLLQSFSVTLTKWYDDFVASQSAMEQDIQRLLLIEYHNLKTYTHALAIQAVLERTRSQNFTCLRNDRLELLSTCYLPEDFAFIHQVMTNSNIILQTAVAMAAEGRLRFIPIRQLQCILSAFVYLFKAITLCTSREDVQASLIVMERCVKALGDADMDEMDVPRDTQGFLHSYVRRLQEDANVFFSPSNDSDHAMDVQVMQGLGESPAVVDAMAASQPLLFGNNFNQDMFAMIGLPADLAMPWSTLDASGGLTGADPLWQSIGSPWDASG
ncbi:hypothetical protein FNYG_11692 [Fusarium nygamai]|uniref:Zn(2)-C6 fungal-type domain-containing protein n=1 Tax=Gibberella nygamai TaxID=42673 RepID=A0A2K0VY61_GIBNY|nr:hypothetical protein FNYG_11692 [Fusarium nygamai]